METNFARTFAALSATNEAILYAKSPEELYEKVCEAALKQVEAELAKKYPKLYPSVGSCEEYK